MLEKIINYIEFFILDRRYRTTNRVKEIVGLKNAKSIGLVYYIDDFDSVELINEFILELQNYKIRVNSLGIYSTKLLPTWSQKTINNSLVQKRKHFNVLNINSKYAVNFIEEDFDILIDFTLKDDFFSTYISALSKARFKLSIESELKRKYFDMLINIKEPALKDFITQLKHYLKIINT